MSAIRYDNVITVTFDTSRSVNIPMLVQWDKGIVLVFPELADGIEVQFSTAFSEETINKQIVNHSVLIPSDLLEKDESITGYIRVITSESEYTEYFLSIPIMARPKPSDYIKPDDEQTFREWVKEQLDKSVPMTRKVAEVSLEDDITSETLAIQLISNSLSNARLVEWLTEQIAENSLIESKANKDDVYNKTETYNKEEVLDLISKVETVHFEKVEVLPLIGNKNTIYLVPAKKISQNNYYDEYIYLNDLWEYIGTTSIDLSDYYTKSQTDTKLNGKQDKLTAGNNVTIDSENRISVNLSDYYTKTIVDTLLSHKQPLIKNGGDIKLESEVPFVDFSVSELNVNYSEDSLPITGMYSSIVRDEKYKGLKPNSIWHDTSADKYYIAYLYTSRYGQLVGWKEITVDGYNKSEIDSKLSEKADRFTVGKTLITKYGTLDVRYPYNNIAIVDNFPIDFTAGTLYLIKDETYPRGCYVTKGVISNGVDFSIEDYGVTDLSDLVLTAGENITIENGVISATGGGIPKGEIKASFNITDSNADRKIANNVSYIYDVSNVSGAIEVKANYKNDAFANGTVSLGLYASDLYVGYQGTGINPVNEIDHRVNVVDGQAELNVSYTDGIAEKYLIIRSRTYYQESNQEPFDYSYNNMVVTVGGKEIECVGAIPLYDTTGIDINKYNSNIATMNDIAPIKEDVTNVKEDLQKLNQALLGTEELIAEIREVVGNE